MRTVLIALAATAVLIAPAHAQMRGGGGGGGKGKQQSAAQQQQSAEKKQKAAEAEKAYKAALDRIPDQKYDPWSHAR
jgi:hypothetical protein